MSKELLAINVNEHTERKGQLTYLSWAWAWAEVLKIDPCARYEVRTFNGLPACYIPGDTALVCVEVVFNSISRECWLPVMDNKNKSIKLPDSFAINTAIMRCMTKAVSLHGIGLYIYAGEDLPQVDVEDPNAEKFAKRTAELEELALHLIDCHEHEKDMDAVRIWYAADTWRDDDPFDANEEKKFVWGLLKTQSKLRSTIKSNSPA